MTHASPPERQAATAAVAGTDPPPLPKRVLFYDGECVLCHWLVRRVIRADRQGRLHVAPLQGETAARLRVEASDMPTGLDTVVLYEEGRLYLRSRAILRSARLLTWPWRLLSAARIIPWFLTDLIYRLVARIRYRVFGKHDACRLPSVEERDRLLP